MNNNFLEKTTKAAPYLIISITLFVTISALISLVLSDVITGQVTGGHISTNKLFGLFISLATTGMLVGCGALFVKFAKEKNYIGFGLVFVIFACLQSADVYFDAISVDIMRFGRIIFTSEMTDKPEAVAHNVYRFLVGGISLVGEPLAVGSLAMFPALKVFLSGILKNFETDFPKHNSYQGSSNQNYQKSTYQPKHKPVHPQSTMVSQKPKLVSPLFNDGYTNRFKPDAKKPYKQGDFIPFNYDK